MKAVVTLLAALILAGMSYAYGYNAATRDSTGTAHTRGFTSQDVWRAVNAYRQGRDLAPMQVYTPLCDNLVARYHAIKDSYDHAGFQEFVDGQVTRGVLPATMMVYEVFASGDTATETVDAWAGSMGHEIAITSHNRGCAYAHNGLAIILMTD